MRVRVRRVTHAHKQELTDRQMMLKKHRKRLCSATRTIQVSVHVHADSARAACKHTFAEVYSWVIADTPLACGLWPLWPIATIAYAGDLWVLGNRLH